MMSVFISCNLSFSFLGLKPLNIKWDPYVFFRTNKFDSGYSNKNTNYDEKAYQASKRK